MAAHAQTTTGQSTGVIEDAGKAVIQGAQVSATQIETGHERQTSANELVWVIKTR